MTLIGFLKTLSAKVFEFSLLPLSLFSPSGCSYDSVPFLMHDYDLRRTTNIQKVMPNASFAHPSSFTWDFLSTLNAGEWFVQPQVRHIPQLNKLLINPSSVRGHVLLLEIKTLDEDNHTCTQFYSSLVAAL